MDVGGQRHAPAILSPEKSPGTHQIESWVGPSACPEVCGKLYKYRRMSILSLGGENLVVLLPPYRKPNLVVTATYAKCQVAVSTRTIYRYEAVLRHLCPDCNPHFYRCRWKFTFSTVTACSTNLLFKHFFKFIACLVS
jgi:hypothetical protein